jgi:hypothetical protein
MRQDERVHQRRIYLDSALQKYIYNLGGYFYWNNPPVEARLRVPAMARSVYTCEAPLCGAKWYTMYFRAGDISIRQDAPQPELGAQMEDFHDPRNRIGCHLGSCIRSCCLNRYSPGRTDRSAL